ncbi:cytosine-specific methyltransferase [Rhizobium albus]|nr:cytosine-specific methyltransferase [Rhizobium albus]
MRYGSVCSGIEAATMAWHTLGWSPAFFSEIEKFPSQVLAHHYGSNMPGAEPSMNGVPNYGDMTKFEEWPDHEIDLLVGGTPCQSFSVAGLRQGLADPRGNLMLTYLAIARRYQPRWLVWENVPGVLSSNGGRDFGTFIRGLEECGYHAAWRVLDAQFVRVDGYERAVPQRRRRVFVVGYLGDWRRAAAVLLEPESLRGDPAPRRQAGEGVAPTISARPSGGGGLGTDFDLDGGLFVDDAARCDTAGYAQRIDAESENFVAFNSREDPEATWDRSGPLGASSPQAQAIAWSIMPQNSGKDYKARAVDVAQPVMAGGPVGGNQGGDYIQQRWAVRRLTPTECERLQGFPDHFTDIRPNGKPTADGPRYKALGNSMAVNAMRWLGQRIAHVESLTDALEAAE